MRIGDLVLKPVAFLCRQTGQGFTIKGTAFFISVPTGSGYRQEYVVTARHLLKSVETNAQVAGKRVKTAFLRVNAKDGRERYDVVYGEWWTPADKGVDLAIKEIDWGQEEKLDAVAAGWEMFATDAIVKHYEIGIGDEVFATGLFANLPGGAHNRPILRHGIIAAMPDEPIVEHPGADPYLAYLVEMRSTGGLSGSPMSIFLGAARDENGRLTKKNPGFLLGVIRAHWKVPTVGLPDPGGVSYDDDTGQIHRGITAVTPIQHLAELLMDERVVKERIARAKAHSDKTGRTFVLDAVHDSASPSE